MQDNPQIFFAYILQSLKDGTLYKGHCQDIEKRLTQHNSGMTSSIKNSIPFRIIYSEQFHTRIEAVKREKYFKSAAGRKFLKRNLQGLQSRL